MEGLFIAIPQKYIMGDLSCDICGQPNVKAQILIEGAKLLVCGRCAKSGKILHYFDDEQIQKPIITAPKSIGAEEEVVEGFGEIIRKARQKKKLSIEELAKLIQEKSNFLHAIESERLKPTITVAKKIEKELGVKLIEIMSAVAPSSVSQNNFQEPTLGDMISREK